VGFLERRTTQNYNVAVTVAGSGSAAVTTHDAVCSFSACTHLLQGMFLSVLLTVFVSLSVCLSVCLSYALTMYFTV